MFTLATKPKVDKIFQKLSKKNKKQIQIIFKKLKEVLENPYRFKPLRGDLHGAYRIHIDKSFVLIYDIDEENNKVIILDYDHHDNIY